MNLGIDLGSTYTIASTYRTDQERLEAIEADLSSGAVLVPSILSLKEDVLKYGTYAKNQTGMKNVQTFKAFKMLMTAGDEQKALERGYDAEHTPQWAMQKFLDFIISKARGKEEVEELVVGAPDIWFHSFGTLSNRSLIQRYCENIEGVKEVKIANEPVLASAYFAYNFYKQSGKPFDGNILIIDYGGGTLDLSLTEIKKGKEKSMEIRMLESIGAGENFPNNPSVGKAGIIYMETLMRNLISKDNPSDVEELLGTEKFYRAVNNLEELLKADTEKIKSNIEDKCGEGETDLMILESLADELKLSDSIALGDDGYYVSYADLKKTYDEVIRQTFNDTMNEMINLATDRHSIDLTKDNGDKLKICLVGGFGKFYFVEEQMRKTLQFNSDDDRNTEEIITEMDREKAISYGAALIASGVVGIRRTAPYSLGIRSENNDGVESVDYMVEYNQEIEINEVNWLKKIFSLGKGELTDCFVIDYGANSKDNIYFTVKAEKQSQFTGLLSENNLVKTCKIGVSFNDSNVPSLHIREFNFKEKQLADVDCKIIELYNFKEIFEERR